MGDHEKHGSSILDALAPYWKGVTPLGTALLLLLWACLPVSPGGELWLVTDGEWTAVLTAAGISIPVLAAPKNKPKKRKGQAGRRAVERARGGRA